ncbi:STAS domain-containing protein [Planococcus sp. CAU13]|uniref:STAS domain-containing protein n=1 Tax=Planococcus sp. CAU13 TaxID=1541197 RepID=UPI00052FE3C0|nr:STAS domain-containing protein [Planococcus sp. CAU13]
MSTVEQFSSYIYENAHSISQEIVDHVVNGSNSEIPKEEQDMALDMYVKLLGFFGDSIQDDNDGVPDHLIEWSKKNAAMQVNAGGRISEIIVRYPPTRDVFIDIMTRISLEIGLSVKDNAFILKMINRMLDVSLNETVFAFENMSNKNKASMQKELVSLSAPIVPVRDEVVVIPLIGYIDKERIQYIIETVVPRIASMDVDYVIADFSGVLTVDSYVAESLQQIGGMFRLMGIKVVTTGMRPELVQAAIRSNIEMSTQNSYSTVKQALETIF